MIRQKFLFIVVLVVLSCLGASTLPASAEWVTDLYSGAALTQHEHATIQVEGVSVSEKLNFDSSFTLGARVAYWFESTPWLGLALDASVFNPDADLTVFPISALLMLRWPLLTSVEFPKGRLQPYAGIGPGLFISSIKVDLLPEVPAQFSDTSIDLGLDGRAGIAWLFAKNTAVFAEYRFTHVSPRFEDRPADLKTRVDVDLNTHHFLVGISFRF